MPDLNKMLIEVEKESSEIKKQVENLFSKYNRLFVEANRTFMRERGVTGSMEGLEDFYTLTRILRRNRDITSSIFRATKEIKTLDKYQVIEEVEARETSSIKEKKKTKAPTPEKEYSIDTSSDIEEQELDTPKVEDIIDA